MNTDEIMTFMTMISPRAVRVATRVTHRMMCKGRE